MTERSFKCPTCGGVVAIPERRRTITITDVRTTHEASCPGKSRR